MTEVGHQVGQVVPAPQGYRPHVVARHFNTAEQEFQAGKLALWLLLAAEVLLFGSLIAAYLYFQEIYRQAFTVGSSLLSWQLGTLSSALLLVSSYAMAMGLRSAQHTLKSSMRRYLLLTLFCGAGFCAIRFLEYRLLPVGFFQGDLAAFPALYFTMTGVHCLHVLVGLPLLLWIMSAGARGRYHAGYYTPVEFVGHYWHFAGLVWIFLFPMLYLAP